MKNKYIVIACLLTVTALTLLLPMQSFSRLPWLSISITIRLVSAVIAFSVAFKFREWSIIFLGVMFSLMGARQIFALLFKDGIIERTENTHMLTEIPGFIVTGLAAISIVYIYILLTRHKRKILEQQDEINELSGLLPICAKCKKIRDDEGLWNRIESYLQDRADVSFTHGMCPECVKDFENEVKEHFEGKQDSDPAITIKANE